MLSSRVNYYAFPFENVILQLRETDVKFFDRSFAKHKCVFIFNINTMKLKIFDFDPKYKQILKPEFWLYETLGGIWLENLTSELGTISVYRFCNNKHIFIACFSLKIYIFLVINTSNVELFLFIWRKKVLSSTNHSVTNDENSTKISLEVGWE